MADAAVETIKPFTIKTMSTRVRDEIIEAARTSSPKITVGQLIERVWEHWKQDDSPDVVVTYHDPRGPVQQPSPVSDADLAIVERVIIAATRLAESGQVPESTRRRANVLLRKALPAAAKRIRPAPKVLLTGPEMDA